MLRHNSVIISADFETTKASTTQNAQIYSWAFCFNKKYENDNNRHRFLIPQNIFNKMSNAKKIIIKDLVYYYGIHVADFVKLLTNVSENTFLLFQNGAKFDLHFLVGELHNQNFISIMNYYDPKIFNQIKTKDYETYLLLLRQNLIKRKKLDFFNSLQNLKFEQIERKLRSLDKKEYYALEVNHNYYYIKICVGTRRKKKIYLTIIDPYKQFVSSLALKAKEVGLEKEIISYNRLLLYKSIKEFEEDGNELHYLLKDVEILYRHSLYMYNILQFHHVELTAASIAYKQILLAFIKKEVNRLTNLKYIKEMPLTRTKGKRNFVKYKIINNDFKLKLKPYLDNKNYLCKKSYFKYIFNEVLAENQIEIKDTVYLSNKYFRGGICHVNEKYRGQIVPAFGYDINSSYPNVMNSDNICPIGPSLDIKVNLFDKNYYLFVHVIALLDLNFEDDLPFLRSTEFPKEVKILHTEKKLKVYHSKRSYITHIHKNDSFFITTTELNWLFKLLKVNNETQFKKYFSFSIDFTYKASTFSFFFKEFVDKWYSIKQNDPHKRTIAKIILNSGYGKFAQKRLQIQPFYQEGKKIDITVFNSIKGHYLPLGIAIPAQARINLCKAVTGHYSSFIYGDTDSAYFVKKIPSIPLSNNLGDWKLEGVFTHFLVRRGKQYVGVNFKDKIAKIVVSGVHLDLEFNYHNINKNLNKDKRAFIYFTQYMGFKKFLTGCSFYNQINAFRSKNGVNLLNIDKVLQPTWKNSLAFNLNQKKIIYEDYFSEIKKAQELDKQFNLPLSQNNCLKTKLDLNYLDKLNFVKLLTPKTS